MKNIVYDAKIAAYILNPTSKYTMDVIARDYLEKNKYGLFTKIRMEYMYIHLLILLHNKG